MDLTLALIDGTVNITENANASGIEVAILNGTLTGAYMINNLIDTEGSEIGGVILVMPGSDITGAAIMWDDVNDETEAFVSEIYINGDLYTTAYSNAEDFNVTYIVDTLSIPGLSKTGIQYYDDAAMTAPLDQTEINSAYLGGVDAYYIVMKPVMITSGTYSEGTGLELYIDNVRYTNFAAGTSGLAVGTHTVRFDVKAGYDGANATITFNGQAVENGGTIEITADMQQSGFTLVASGAVPMDYASGSSGDSGMGLTEILLVILVILIVVMAIMVALRLMRS